MVQSLSHTNIIKWMTTKCKCWLAHKTSAPFFSWRSCWQWVSNTCPIWPHVCLTNSDHVKSQVRNQTLGISRTQQSSSFSSRSLSTPIGQVRSGQVRCRSLNLASRKCKLIIAYMVVLPFIANVNITLRTKAPYTCMHHGNSSYYITSLCKHSIGWIELLFNILPERCVMCRCVVCCVSTLCYLAQAMHQGTQLAWVTRGVPFTCSCIVHFYVCKQLLNEPSLHDERQNDRISSN